MSVRHINARRGEHVVVHRRRPPRQQGPNDLGAIVLLGLGLAALLVVGIALCWVEILIIGGGLLAAIALRLLWVKYGA